MNRRLLLILLSALGVALVSAYIVYRIVGPLMQGSKQLPSTTIVAARNDIKIGTVLSAQDLTDIQVVGVAPRGTIRSEDKKSVIGRGVVSALYAGEPILENRLAPKGSGGGLAAIISQGMRACAVKVDEVVGVAGFVTPGMRVDVLVSGVPPNAATNQQTEVRTILQNIEVLSAGTDIQKDQEGKPQQVQVVNLLVTPDQAQVLTLAGGSGLHIQLVLRNPLDTTVSPVNGNAVGNLFSEQKTASKAPIRRASKAPAPQAFTIQVYNGATRSDEKFATPEGKK